MPNQPVYRANVSRWGWWLVLAGLLMVAPQARGYMAFERGISVPVVVHDDKVYFVQADSVITVLDLHSGALIRRLHDGPEAYRVESVDAGLYVHGRERIVLLDWDTLEEVWSQERTGTSFIIENRPRIVLLQDNDATLAIDTATGETRWRVPGNAQQMILLEDQAMMINRPPYDDPDGAYEAVLIEIDTGAVLKQVAVELSQPYHDFAFDGSRLYTYYYFGDERDYGAMRILDDGATEPADIEAVSAFQQGYVRIEGTVFNAYGEPVDPDTAEREARLDREAAFHEDGFAVYDHEPSGIDDGYARLQIEDEGNTFRLIVPHAPAGRAISMHFDRTDRYILMSTPWGQVECFDRETGTSRWLYVSPSIVQTLSYSGNTHPYISTLIGDFDRQFDDSDKRTPSLRLPDGAGWAIEHAIASDAAVIEDPDPFDPFTEMRELTRYVYLATLLPPAFLLCGMGYRLLFKNFRGQVLTLSAMVGIAFTFPVLRYAGKLSLPGSLVLATEMVLLAALVVVLLIKAIKLRRGWLVPGLCTAGLVASLWWALPILGALAPPG